MKEQIFVTEVLRSLRLEDVWAYKIPDAPITKELLKITRFTAAKPCDIVACMPNLKDSDYEMDWHGQFLAIECKQFKKWKAFSKRDLQDSQIEHMPKIIHAKGLAYVFLNIRIKSPHENRLIIFEFSDLMKQLDKGSIFAKDLKQMKFIPSMQYEGKTIYNLSDWITRI